MSAYEKYKHLINKNYIFPDVPDIGITDKNGLALFFLSDIKSCRLSYEGSCEALVVETTSLPKDFLVYIKDMRNEPHHCELYYAPRDSFAHEYNEDFVHIFDCDYIHFEMSNHKDEDINICTIIFYKNNQEGKDG